MSKIFLTCLVISSFTLSATNAFSANGKCDPKKIQQVGTQDLTIDKIDPNGLYLWSGYGEHFNLPTEDGHVPQAITRYSPVRGSTLIFLAKAYVEVKSELQYFHIAKEDPAPSAITNGD